MRPIVILYPSKDNKISLTKEDFEEYLRQAYDAGYSDGYNAGKNNNWWNTPITWYGDKWTNTTPNIQPNYTHITCDAHNDIGG